MRTVIVSVLGPGKPMDVDASLKTTSSHGTGEDTTHSQMSSLLLYDTHRRGGSVAADIPRACLPNVAVLERASATGKKI